jgi:hypothetical protein
MPNGYGTLILPHLVSQPGIPIIGGAGDGAGAAEAVIADTSMTTSTAENGMLAGFTIVLIEDFNELD